MFLVASLRAVGSALWRVPELRRRWLVGAIDGRRLPSDCALAPQRNSTRGGNFRRGKVPDYEAGWRSCVYVRTSPRWMSLDGICSGFRRASACPATLNTSRWTEKNEACSWTRKCSMMIHVKYRISETDAHSLARYLPIFQSGFHSFSSLEPYDRLCFLKTYTYAYT